MWRNVNKAKGRLRDLPQRQDRYPSLSKFWDLIFQHYNTQDNTGLDYVDIYDGDVHFYDQDRELAIRKEPLVFLDNAVRSLIEHGYHVESIAVNPSTRSQFKHYWRSLFLRSHLTANISPVNTTNAASPSLNEEASTAPSSCDASSCDSPQPRV